MTCSLCRSLVYAFFVQAEDGIRDLVRSRGLGDVYKRQSDRHVRSIAGRLVEKMKQSGHQPFGVEGEGDGEWVLVDLQDVLVHIMLCLLYTSDAADERSSVDLGGRRIIKKKNMLQQHRRRVLHVNITISHRKQHESPKFMYRSAT